MIKCDFCKWYDALNKECTMCVGKDCEEPLKRFVEVLKSKLPKTVDGEAVSK